jgi:adenine-specific DNA-methyltransferase
MTPLESGQLESVFDHIVWYAKDKAQIKYRNLFRPKLFEGNPEFKFRQIDKGFEEIDFDTMQVDNSLGVFKRSVLESSGFTASCMFPYGFHGHEFSPRGRKSWRTNSEGMRRLDFADRLFVLGTKLYYKLYYDDF